ncbi:hypothetical protein V2G26_018266 [Clonostachys chloroleuca]
MSEKLSTRCALLIGCPVGSLRGVETDLSIMQSILEEHGFTCTQICPATREKTLVAWNPINDQTFHGGAVVIYYSGHGGMAEEKDEGNDGKTCWRLQYLVPIDGPTWRKCRFPSYNSSCDSAFAPINCLNSSYGDTTHSCQAGTAPLSSNTIR